MQNNVIEKTIEINAPLDQVWRVFTDPDVTRQMGGYYETGWKMGSTFGWKGQDGNLHTKGILLDFLPRRLIKHSLFEPDGQTWRLLHTSFRKKTVVRY